MGQNFVAADREQAFLLPPDVRDWLPEGHFAWFVIEAVAQMDLAASTCAACRRPSASPTQLLTAWAGTLADAADTAHAVFAAHEFRTDQRPEDKSSLNGAELTRFADAILGCDLPSPDSVPWCACVPDVAGIHAALYVAHVVTDLRGAALPVASA